MFPEDLEEYLLEGCWLPCEDEEDYDGEDEDDESWSDYEEETEETDGPEDDD